MILFFCLFDFIHEGFFRIYVGIIKSNVIMLRSSDSMEAWRRSLIIAILIKLPLGILILPPHLRLHQDLSPTHRRLLLSKGIPINGIFH
jgi:hypothetical protein